MRKLDLREFIHEGSLVFDVGANVGVRTAEYLNLGAKVVCFEPNVWAQQILSQQYNADSHVIVEPVGLYDHEGILEFFPAELSAQSTFSRDLIRKTPWLTDQWKSSYKVRVSTLDVMFEKYGVPEFVKIDVEGSEQFVLKGMSTMMIKFSLPVM